MAAASLAVRISAQIGEFQKSFNDASKTVNKFAGEFEGIATRAAAVGSFIGNIAADIAKSVASGLGSAIKDAVKFSSEFSNAFIGLGSVARAFGTDSNLATTAAKRLSADGLLPLKDSATGLKNLLATGFNLPQAIKLMDAFKDSSAFGRQSSLSFGDAVRSATEGVKNGNSILVDNSGITKNLSQILKEAGFSAQDLSRASSDAGVRMALFNGILKEAAAQTGDAQRLTQTYTGQVARLDTAYRSVLATVGDSITKNATLATTIGSLSDALIGVNSGLSNNRNGLNLVSDGVIFLVKAFAEVINVIDLVQTAFSGLQAFSNRTFEAFSNIGIAVFKTVEKIETLNKVLDPVRFQQHAAGAREAADAYTFLEGASQGFRDATTDAEKRSFALGNTLQEVRARASALGEELKATRGQTVELGNANGPLVDRAKASAAALDGLGKKAKDAKDEVKRLTEEMRSVVGEVGSLDAKIGHFGDGFTKSVENLVNRVNGVPLSDKAHEWAEALKEPGVAVKVLADTHLRQELNGVLIEVIDKFGSLKAAGVDALSAIGAQTFSLPALTQLTQLPGDLVKIPSLPPSTLQQLFDPKAIGTALGNAISGAIQGGGNVFAAAAGALGQTFTTGLAKHLTASVADGGKAIGGFLGGAVNAVLPGIGALLGPLVGKITSALAGAFGLAHAGRDVVKDFAATFDTFNLDTLKFDNQGFDNLHAKLLGLGAQGEKLWIALTQGVGSNNPTQAKAVIDLITAALADQKTVLGDVAAASTDAGSAQSEAFIKAKDAIAGMQSQIDSLNQSIANEAPEEILGVIEQQTRAQIDAIVKQRDEAQIALDQTAALAATSAELAAKAIDDTLAAHDFVARIKVYPEYIGFPDGFGGSGAPKLAAGGIVRRPTLALVGEAGPEAVVPLSQFSGGGGGSTLDVTLVMPDGDVLLRQVVKAKKRLGL